MPNSRLGDEYEFHHLDPSKRRRLGESQEARIAIGTPRRFGVIETPRPRKLAFCTDLEAEIEEDEETETAIQDVVAGNWTVYRVSPLYTPNAKRKTEFDYGRKDDPRHDITKPLQKALGTTLEPLIREWNFVSLDQNHKQCCTVKVDDLKGLRGNAHDAAALSVSVTAKRNEKAKERSLMKLFLLAVESTELKDLNFQVFTSLPCCLVQGEVRVIEVAFDILQKMFDCYISRVHFEDKHFKWMLTFWGWVPDVPELDNIKENLDKNDPKEIDDDDASKSNHEVVIGYGFDADVGCQELTCMELSIKHSHLRKMWNRYFQQDGKESITEHDIQTFNQFITDLIRNTYGVLTEFCHIKQLTLPLISVKDSGKFKINRSDRVKAVLSFLTEICESGMTDTPYPSLSKDEMANPG